LNSTSGYPSDSSPSVDLYAGLDGWEFLEAGDAREARRSFDRAINVYPNDGLPRIGYALSAAMLSRDAEAVDEMRRALREDPEAIREVPQNQELWSQIQPLIDSYLRLTKQSPHDVDALFMLAALHYIDGNDSMAYFAIDRGIDLGDRDLSSVNLKTIIQNSLNARPIDSSEPLPAQAPEPAPAPTTPGDWDDVSF
jgi:tetratricopeptide (TPR) repeat protein